MKSIILTLLTVLSITAGQNESAAGQADCPLKFSKQNMLRDNVSTVYQPQKQMNKQTSSVNGVNSNK